MRDDDKRRLRQHERDAGGYPGINLVWSDQMVAMILLHERDGVFASDSAKALNVAFPFAVRPFTKNTVVAKLWRMRRARIRDAEKTRQASAGHQGAQVREADGA